MKKKKKYFIIGIILVLVVSAIICTVYFYSMDKSRLNVTEKRYLAENSAVVQNIDILNNIPIFGSNGTGVFYDFLEDFYQEYGIKTNPVLVEKNDTTNNVYFNISNTYNDEDFVFYEGHYVLISKTIENFSKVDHLENKKIGVLSENLSYITSFLENQNLTIQTYNTNEELMTAFEEQKDINYMIIPLEENIESILKNNYYISYHFSDIPFYYKVTISKNKTFGKILGKYFLKWNKQEFQDSYKQHLFKLFTDSLGISLTEIDAMQSISYDYGFVSNSPYEILTGGNYGGIIAQYLKEFVDFTDTEVKFTKYK